MHGMQEVTGSIPVFSTRKKKALHEKRVVPFCVQNIKIDERYAACYISNIICTMARYPKNEKEYHYEEKNSHDSSTWFNVALFDWQGLCTFAE